MYAMYPLYAFYTSYSLHVIDDDCYAYIALLHGALDAYGRIQRSRRRR